MTVKQSIHGYESKTAAVRALRAKGLKSTEIGRLLGISAKHASALMAYRVKGSGRTVVIHGKTLDALARHAEVRAVTVNELVRRILDTIASENMVNVVLDDPEAREATRGNTRHARS